MSPWMSKLSRTSPATYFDCGPEGTCPLSVSRAGFGTLSPAPGTSAVEDAARSMPMAFAPCSISHFAHSGIDSPPSQSNFSFSHVHTPSVFDLMLLNVSMTLSFHRPTVSVAVATHSLRFFHASFIHGQASVRIQFSAVASQFTTLVANWEKAGRCLRYS